MHYSIQCENCLDIIDIDTDVSEAYDDGYRDGEAAAIGRQGHTDRDLEAIGEAFALALALGTYELHLLERTEAGRAVLAGFQRARARR